MRSTSTAGLLRAIPLIALLAGPAWAMAHPLVMTELKHDQSGALRDVTPKAKAGGAQSAQQAQSTRAPLVSAESDPVARTPSGALGVGVGLNFDGISAQDTVASGGPFVPFGGPCETRNEGDILIQH